MTRAIPDEIVEEVRARADLVEIVSEHTTLKRTGRTFRGPCPLHGGKGPNFSVDPAKNLFKCFVCGEGGDVFGFPMKMLGMDFPDAIRWVAERAGVEIPEPEAEPRENPNRPLYEAVAFAAAFYRDRLEDPEGEEAREYLEGRGIGEAHRERFGLGWAPEGWRHLLEAAGRHGISEEVLLELGLVKRPEREGREPYDAFRGRVIFPIEDLGGRVVAFGGRIVGSHEEHVPKYINSSDSPIYHKGEILYGLGWSRGAIRRDRTALVVEGYMDYLSLAAAGVENVVAPLGTAMTERQAELVSRYAERAILLYDSDQAGLRATFRSADALLRAAVEVLVATLPEGEDPDSVVRGGGAAALRPYLDDAVDVLERKIQILERSGYFDTIPKRRRAVDALLPTVRAAADEVLRDVYLNRVSERTGVSRSTLDHELAAVDARERRTTEVQERRRYRPGGRPEDVPPGAGVPTPGAERNLLLLLLRDESWVERAAQVLSVDDFRNPAYAELYQAVVLAEGRREGNAWLDELSPDAQRVAEELRDNPEGAQLAAPELFFEANLKRLQVRPFEERLAGIQRQLGVATPEEQLPLLLEWNEVLQSMREQGLPLRPGLLKPPRED
jgi:DNA primase